MNTVVREAGWLPEPVVEFDDEEAGDGMSAYISLRPGKCHDVIQPHEDYLVFLYVGADRMPIGIRMLEPATNWVGTEIVQRLLTAPRGRGAAMDGPERFHVPPMTLDQIDAVIHRIREVNGRLEPKTAPAK
jgi:hypothetical protein